MTYIHIHDIHAHIIYIGLYSRMRYHIRTYGAGADVPIEKPNKRGTSHKVEVVRQFVKFLVSMS